MRKELKKKNLDYLKAQRGKSDNHISNINMRKPEYYNCKKYQFFNPSST